MTTRSIVIYRLGSLGDTVVALPCFHQIARSFPEARRLVLTNCPVASVAPALETILGPSGLIGGVIPYSVGERSIVQLAKLALKLRATGASTMIYLAAGRGRQTVRRDLQFFRLSGFTEIIGAPLEEELHDNRFDPKTGTYEPEAERLARTMEPLARIDLKDRANWDLRLTEDELATADESLGQLRERPFFAINVGGKQAINYWGEGRWCELLGQLAPLLADHALVALGSDGDEGSSERLIAGWPGSSKNLCGRLSPRQSAAVLKRARFFVGHDSGPLHLAAAVDTPSVGLFGNHDPPRIWHPYGEAHRPIHDIRGVDHILVPQVYAAVMATAERTR